MRRLYFREGPGRGDAGNRSRRSPGMPDARHRRRPRRRPRRRHVAAYGTYS